MISDALEAYILAHIDDEGSFLSGLSRDAHVNLLRPRMMSGHLQGRLLKMFCRMMRPKRILEIGTYTGYATFCLAEGIADDACIHTIEMNDELQPFVQPYLEKSPHKNKIQIHWGDVKEVLPTLNEIFDLVFIDADKRDYCDYFDWVYPVLRPGGIILADNTLWSEKVLDGDPDPSDAQTKGIMAFNEKIKKDARVEKVIVPLRDGLTIIYKPETDSKCD